MSANANYSAEFFEPLAAVQGTHFWYRARAEIIAWALRPLGDKPIRFLEVGCGTGSVLEALQARYPHWQLVGREPFADAVAIARQKLPRAGISQGDFFSLSEKSEFDAVAAFDVLEHLEDDVSALGRLFEACRPGGTLVVTVPQHRFLWSPVDEAAGHKRRYRESELRQKVSAAGFVVDWSTSFVTLLLPLLFALRAAKRAGAGNPVEEFDIGPVTNRCLSSVMSLEFVLLSRLGWRLPVGGSRILVAHKPR